MPASLEVIAEPAPALPEATVAGHVAQHYGLSGALQPLVSERDQNFRLQRDDGARYVVKIANRAERRDATEFQVAVLERLARQHCGVAVPEPVASYEGSALTTLQHDGVDYSLRVVTWLDGRPAEDVNCTNDLAFSLGQSLAHLDVALADIEFADDGQHLLWDVQQAGDLRALLHYIDNADLRRQVASCLDDVEANAAPAFETLRRQLIHNDLNPGNVLVSSNVSDTVAGVIDFGDMVRAPLIVDVAVALSYLRRFDGDPFELPCRFISGYSRIQPLEEREIALLYDLVRIRLATTITILHWRVAARSDEDPYLEKSLVERGAQRFLALIDSIPRDRFTARIHAAASS